MSTTKQEAPEDIEGLLEQVEMDDIIARLDRRALLRQFLQEEAWPLIPEGEAGRRLSRDEEEQLLGYGPAGV